jgi:hypothetical protein
MTAINFKEERYPINKYVDIALIAILKDCGPRVQEWLAFHYIQGVRAFFLALHDCTDDTEEQINKLPFRHLIQIHHITTVTDTPIVGTFNKLFEYYKHCARWMMVIDDDEFCFPVERDVSLLSVIERYADYGGVCPTWQWYGSNNHVVRPTCLVMEAYTKRANVSFVMTQGCKSIIRTDAYQYVQSSHLCKTDPPCCDVQYNIINPLSHWKTGYPPVLEALRINHYKVKSMEDWCARVRRGDCAERCKMPTDVKRFVYEDRNEIIDEAILRYVPQVKKILGI